MLLAMAGTVALSSTPDPEWTGTTVPAYAVFPDKKMVVEPILGRPTDTSVTLNIVPAVDMDLYIEYGHSLGRHTSATAVSLTAEARRPVEVMLSGLDPDSAYEYRVLARRMMDRTFNLVSAGSFHTQRAPGSRFVFTVQADSHIINRFLDPGGAKCELYTVALENALDDGPDFHIDLGDFAHIEHYVSGSVHSLDEAVDRYLVQRKYLGALCDRTPFFLVLGNHEGEQGWRRTSEWDSVEVWGMTARKLLIPNPRPDGFYTGCEEVTECCGLRESYYAWEWGDALFVVLDPFWNTMQKPHRLGGKYPCTCDGWDWTLGLDQYNWLYETLNASSAKWKFVFCHHMTGGFSSETDSLGYYGRGGIPVAKHRVAGFPSFEWGGEDSTGNCVFEEMRPGWTHGPIHDMMRSAGVDIFFHGHDHVFVYETLDGIFYQACPQPTNVKYDDGFFSAEFYSGRKRNNSGHLRVSVSADSVQVDYVHAVLGADDPIFQGGLAIHNGDIAYTYILTD
jgi:hypothetical protein